MAQPRICTCTTLRAPLADTLRFVAHHLGLGVERMYLFFDDPEDPAIAALGGEPRLSVFRCDDAHWAALGGQRRAELSLNTIQRLNSTIAIEHARREGLEWILHIDSDELVHVQGRLGERFAGIPADVDVVKINPLEFVPEDAGGGERLLFKRACIIRFPSALPFGRLDDLYIALQSRLHPRLLQLAAWLGVREAQHLGFIKGHQSGKAATRLRAPVEALGCHWPLAPAGTVMRAAILHRAHLLHFDAPDFEAWMNKWICRLDGSARTGASGEMKGSRAQQFEEFTRLYRAGDRAGLRRLYDRLFRIRARERVVLRLLGLLCRVRVGTRNPSPAPCKAGGQARA